jgi:hypothetical protein
MTVTATSFRLNHEEFADDQKYPDTLVNQYINLAKLFVNPDVWTDATDYGTELWVAHNVAIAGEKMNGGDIFGVTGIHTGEHVGEVGFTADPKLLFGGLTDAGFYARSSFGLQFWQLAKMFGGGGRQL